MDGRNIASESAFLCRNGTLRDLQGTFKVPFVYAETIAIAVVLLYIEGTLKVPWMSLKVPFLHRNASSLALFPPSTVAPPR